MKYTVFEYMYRDAANYKLHASLWLEGDLADRDAQRFRTLLESDEFFIAEQVGVPSLQSLNGSGSDLGTDDHVWHTFVGFRTERCLPKDQTSFATCSAFFRLFETVAGKWFIQQSDFYEIF
jgi:hypothetical protein